MSRQCGAGLLAIVLLSVAARASAQTDVEKRLNELERRVKALESGQQQLQAAPSPSPASTESLATWIEKVRLKIRSNINLTGGIPRNPEVVFEIALAPTGEVQSAKRIRSSGNAAWDDTVQRAILRSSPLPKPDNPAVFRSPLQLQFRPQERF